MKWLESGHIVSVLRWHIYPCRVWASVLGVVELVCPGVDFIAVLWRHATSRYQQRKSLRGDSSSKERVLEEIVFSRFAELQPPWINNTMSD